MQRAAWGAIALVVLAPALAAAPLPTKLDVHAGAAGLTVQLDPATADVSAYLVVSHEDPLLGSIVDRVVPVDVPLGASLNVSVQQLRPDVNVSVALLDQAGLDGLLTKASSLLNGSLLPSLPVIGQVDVGSLLPAVNPFDLYAYPYATADVSHPRVLANAAGVVAVAYLATVGDGALGEPMLRLSRDGGHRFEDPIHLMPGETATANTVEGAFTSHVAPDGQLLFAAGHDDGEHRLERVTVARLDPATGAVTRASTQVVGNGRPSAYSPLLFDDGTVLVVGHGPVSQTGIEGPVVLKIAPNGTLQETGIEPVAHAYRTSDQTLAVTGMHGSAAVVWAVGQTDAPVLRYATTYDGGRTWATRNVTGLPSGVLQVKGALDNLGTLHLAAVIWNGSNSTMRYVQAPRVGEPHVASLPWTGDPIGSIAQPSIAAFGGRAWILATVRTTKDPVQDANGFAVQPRTVAWESLPGPLGLRAPYQFKVTGAFFTFDEGTPTLLPDGRLVVTGFSGGRALVPLFDPFPEPACAANHPAAPSYTGPPSAVLTCAEAFSFLLIPGGVSLAPFNAPILGVTPPNPSPPLAAAPTHPVTVPLPPLPALATGAVAVAGAAGIAALAMTDAVRYGIGLLLASLFSRVQGKQVLQHAIRGGIYDHILANPGIRFNHLRKDLGLSHGATAYHLQVLARNGLVRQRTAWSTRHYYTAGAPPPPALEAHDAILDFVRSNPGAGAAEVGRHLGLSRQLAHYHLRRLAAAGRTAARRP